MSKNSLNPEVYRERAAQQYHQAYDLDDPDWTNMCYEKARYYSHMADVIEARSSIVPASYQMLNDSQTKSLKGAVIGAIVARAESAHPSLYSHSTGLLKYDAIKRRSSSHFDDPFRLVTSQIIDKEVVGKATKSRLGETCTAEVVEVDGREVQFKGDNTPPLVNCLTRFAVDLTTKDLHVTQQTDIIDDSERILFPSVGIDTMPQVFQWQRLGHMLRVS